MFHTLGSGLRLSGASPSMSIFWYTQMQLFLRFGTYFQVLLAGLPFLIVVPTAIRLYRYPITMIGIFWFAWILLQPVSTLYDLNVGLCFFAMSPRSLARVNGMVCLVALFALCIPTILVVLLYWMWLEVGNGEANFLFFQCLAYNIFLLVLLLQFVHASVGRDKALCLAEKREKECIKS
mmetsp:Transcript_11210/g.14754  ORF Transcript_11210/g.14754 Transcript_11210/m.14754 type:complete len:179 (-) Transcript_11210:426-962(-)